MNDVLEQQKIIDKAKALNPNVSAALVKELSDFINSEMNQTELTPASQKQLCEKILKVLVTPQKADEN